MKTVQVDEEGGIPLSEFAGFVDTSRVDSYRIETDASGAVIVTFYDVNGKQLTGM